MSEPILISVGGGKGGVGKSVVAANLAVACAQLGFRTVLVDADFGAANQHTLFGVDRPHRTLQALVDREVESLEAVATPTGLPRLFLVAGVGAVPGAANLNHAQKLKVMRHVRRLDADVVLVDVGAGVSFNVLDYFALGDLRLVVTSPQLTAMQNAYCFLKAAVHRCLRRRADTHAQRELFKVAQSDRETDRVADLRQRIARESPDLAATLGQVTRGFGGRVVGNMLEGPSQRKVLQALCRMSKDFLDLELPLSTTLPMSRSVHESVTRRRPLVTSQPGHTVSRGLCELAEELLSADVAAIRAQRHEEEPDLTRDVSDEDLLGVGLIDYLRRDERVRVDHEAEARVQGRTAAARVRDLSASGALVEARCGAAEGDAIQLWLTGLPGAPALAGVVRHVAVSGEHCGVELDGESRHTAARLLEPDVPRRSQARPFANAG